MTRIPIFSEQSIVELKRDHDRLERMVENITRRLSGFRNELQTEPKVFLVKLDGTVSGRSGTTPGSQTATVCQFDGSDIVARGESVTVYNAFESDSGAANTYVFVIEDFYGTLWVISEDCP